MIHDEVTNDHQLDLELVVTLSKVFNPGAFLKVDQFLIYIRIHQFLGFRRKSLLNLSSDLDLDLHKQ